MAADHVVVTFTTDSKQLAEALVDHLNAKHRAEIHHLVVSDKSAPVFADPADG